ncbi:MAG: hypothetical protein ACLFV7_00420 [Phycisphaerae bacterium]
MRFTRMTAGVLCIAMLASLSMAQVPGIPGAKKDTVLTQVPSGSMGVVVINDLDTMAGKIDKFIGEIGLGQMAQQAMPNGLLKMITQQAGLGEKFSGKGDVAIVMLDPKTVNMDFAKLVKQRMDMMMPSDQMPPEPEEVKLPFVVYLPGTDIENIFKAYNPVKKGDFYQLTLPTGPMMATTRGKHILLSPGTDALNVCRKSNKGMIGDIRNDHVMKMLQSEIGIHMNMKVTGPIVNDIIKTFEQFIAKQEAAMAQGGGGPAAMMVMGPMMMVKKILPTYRDRLSQLNAVTMVGRFVETGLLVEELGTYKKDSEMGKEFLAYKPTDKDLLGNLPDLPYVVAGGCHNMPGISKGVDIYLNMIDSMLQMSPAGPLGAQRGKIDKFANSMIKETDTLQFVVGGAANGNGLFGVTCVMDGDDARKITGLMKEGTQLIDTVLRQKLGQMDPDAAQLKLAYIEDAGSVSGTKLHAVDITHPDLAGMSERERTDMKKVLGEDRIRFYLAQADKDTVVATFAGSTDQMAASLKTANGKGTLGSSKWMAEPRKYMPKKPAMLMVVNGSNLFDLIISGIRKMNPDEELPAGRISCRTPVALGVGIEGDTATSTLYVPTKLVKDAVVLYLSMQGGGGGAVGDDSF